jgi:catechol 2,3-dioxygenase
MTTATDFFDMNAAPMRIGRVRLRVRDFERVAGFYRTILGLTPIDTDESRITLGTGTTPLLELAADAALAPLDPAQAGLFHTAFLLPTRADLAGWVAHAAEARVPLQGASDHIVSEALYLADPEGERSGWRPIHSICRICCGVEKAPPGQASPRAPASATSIFRSATPRRPTASTATCSASTSLPVTRARASTAAAATTTNSPGNVWNSRNAGSRPDAMAGLDRVEIVVRDAAEIANIAARAEGAGTSITNDRRGITMHDPWGTAIALTH